MATATADFTSLADVAVPFAPASPAGLDDNSLIEAQRTLAEIRRRVDATAAVFASEIARRSRPELGYDGLAQRLGARTPQHLVQRVTGTTAREAGSLVRAGNLIDSAASAPDGPTWLREVASAVA